MTQDKRIKLRPTEAAAYLNKSVANLYWKAKYDPGFPKPRKYEGKRASYFFRDELDLWKANEAAGKQSPFTPKPNIQSLTAVLLLLGETKDSIARAYLIERPPKLPNHRSAFMPQPGEPGYVPPHFPEWATEQHQQDLITLHMFTWERVWAEMQKAARLLAEQPELSRNVDFAAYQQAIRHATEVVAGRVDFESGHRIGTWAEGSCENGNA